MPERIPQSTTIRVPLQAYLSTDHVSAATGKTIAITVSKNGAAYGNPNAGATNATEIANGSYYVDLATTDSGTIGPLFVRGTSSGVDDIIIIYDVVKATNAGFTALPDAAVNTNGGLPILSVSGTTLGYTISTLTTYTGDTPQTGDSYARIGAAGVSLTAIVAASVATDYIRTGTAQSGSNATNIKLDSGASSTNDLYKGLLVRITGGTGVGQVRCITNYNGSSKFATTDRNWATAPDNTSIFALLPTDTPSLNANLQVQAGSSQATIRTGTAQSGSTSNTIKLDSAASSTNNLYNNNLVQITGGTGLGQARTIVSYNGTTKVATVDRDWITTPDATTTFSIVADTTSSIFSNQGVAQAATSSTITLASTASSVNDIYKDSLITILSGTDAGDTAEITGYVGSTKVATVSPNWSSTPDTTSAYAVIPLSQSSTSSGTDTPGVTTLLARIASQLAITAAGGVTLGDDVAHGGTPGSSNATFAMQQVDVTNSGGDAFLVRSTGGGGRGFVARGDSGGAGIFTQGGDTGIGFHVRGGSTSGDGMRLQALGTGAGLVVDGSANSGLIVNGDADFAAVIISSFGTGAGIAIDAQDTGAGISIQSSGGHAISALASGSGKKALLLAGDAATDSLAIAVGAGSPIDILNTNGKISINLDATELAKLLTMDSTKAWNDVVAGSIAKLIADNVKIYITGLGI